MAKNNPTTLNYVRLTKDDGPRFGVSDSKSTDWKTAVSATFAWFCDLQDAKRFGTATMCNVWNLEDGVLVP